MFNYPSHGDAINLTQPHTEVESTSLNAYGMNLSTRIANSVLYLEHEPTYVRTHRRRGYARR